MTTRFASLSDDQLRAIHTICEAFEQEVAADDSASHDDDRLRLRVESAPSDVAAALLSELLSIELEWRFARSQSPTLSQLLLRFPGHNDVVTEVFGRISEQVLAAQRFAPGSVSALGNVSRSNSPQKVGRYRIESELGKGSFGTVYRAYDEALKRIVALKVPHPGLSPAWGSAIMAEARSAASLQHPHIVPVFDVLEDQEYSTCIVSQFVAGTDLASLIKRQPLPFATATRIAISIADALHHAHSHRLVHRDVKPANVLVDIHGEAHLTDFGLALHDERLGGGKSFVGTVAYMSPEQARGEGHSIDARSDVYSLGIVLYEMLTGCRPYQASTPSQLLHLIETHEPRSLQLINEDIPIELQRICAKAMSWRVCDRYSSASDMAGEMRLVLTDVPRATDSSNGDAWQYRSERDSSPPSDPDLEMRLRVSKQTSTTRQREMMVCASRFHIRRAVTVCLVLTLITAMFAQIVIRSRHRNSVALVVTTVNSLEISRGLLIPVAIKALEQLPSDIVLGELRSRFAREPQSQGKLPIAVALAHFGDVRCDYLVDAIELSSPEDAVHLFTAVSRARDDCLKVLVERYQRQMVDHNWRLLARYAITALHLDDPAIARDMCRFRSDLVRRSVFIDELSQWHGDNEYLAALMETEENSDLRSCLCLAIGRLSPQQLGPDAVSRWSRLFAQWYEFDRNSLTHSAAGWALRNWSVDVPVARTRENFDGNWYARECGITMIHVPAGSFVRRDNTLFSGAEEQTVVVTKPFWLSDREVTRRLFDQFLHDVEIPAENKPVQWSIPVTAAEISPTPDHPMNNVSWFDAVLFCNWLSKVEGLEPAYQRIGEPRTSWRNAIESWQWNRQSNGYRLPTEAEWELACRAGTDTTHFFGSAVELMPRYGVFATGKLQRSTSMLPNHLGLFGMIGNASEWCYDWSNPYPTEPTLQDPICDHHPDEHNSKVTRGGTFFDYAAKCSSGSRNRNGAWSRADYDGFRVARSISE